MLLVMSTVAARYWKVFNNANPVNNLSNNSYESLITGNEFQLEKTKQFFWKEQICSQILN